jgi:50S ribosomal protein L16 3-hydroxylase
VALSPHPRLGGLTARAFLRDHWQRRPLLVRGAFPGWTDPLSPDELAGLATEPDAHARIVRQTDAPPHWRVDLGPFDPDAFTGLPEDRWTLLVRHVDLYVPGVVALLADFRFLPSWRVDDVMVSYAAPGGTVGPHLDSYDVFLIQGQGKRRWQVGAGPVQGPPDLLPGLDLQVLADFRPAEEWVLEPGDMLYLPPRVPHHGVAEGECLTYSVGFRAPTRQEVLAGFLEAAVAAADPEDRYADLGLSPTAHPGRIAPQTLAWARKVVREAVGTGPEIDAWFGRHLTEGPEPEGGALAWKALRAHVARGRPLARPAGVRAAYTGGRDGPTLFMAGEDHPLPARLAPLVRLLADADRYSAEALAPWLDDPDAAPLLRALAARGLLEKA